MMRAIVLFCLATGMTPAKLPAQDWIWIEGEAPSSANVKTEAGGWGNKQFLSGESWLQVNIDADKVEKAIPADGAVLRYEFSTKVAGLYEVWNRVGFEFVRSPFDWRVDGEPWTASRPEELTTDLMEIGFFTEVAWLKLGDRRLSAGKHALEIRLNRTVDDKGQPVRILYTSDAILLHPGHFSPNGKFKPGDDGRADRDRKAESVVFSLPAPNPGERSSVALNGVWEISRDDEQMPGEVAAPIAALPKTSFWRAIDVPGDKNTLRPDLVFAHRVWYRTRVEVPEAAAGRSFVLEFPQNNLNTTVYVNGVLCGFDKNPFARVRIDVTKAMKPGRNEVMVGIRDAWYGRSADPENPLKLRKTFNLPKKFFSDGFQDLAYPIWNNPQSGILVTPRLICAGPAYVSDVFCKPSVATKKLDLDVTVTNPTSKPVTLALNASALDGSGRASKTFAPVPVQLAPGETRNLSLSESWPDAKLWWPDSPTMYRLRAVLSIDGKPGDTSETAFGFRSWTISGKDFLLNGVPWHGWADTHNQEDPKSWLAFQRQTNQTFMRFWGTSWLGLPPEEALDFLDENGVVVRRSGMLDGEAIGYNAIENDEKFRKKFGTEVKMDLLRNWRDQMVAHVKGERNHPSIMLWSIENEYLYINCINLFGGLMDQFEKEVVATSDAVRRADPTRPTMTDGGGATKSNAMPVHGDHYTAGPFPQYPSLAYTPNTRGGGRGRWEWDQKRPRFIGEELFAEGHNPSYSYFGGEEVFGGKSTTRRAVGIAVRMITEGLRWTGQGAVHFWQTQGAAEGQYVANAPRAVFCRQWNWSFGSGTRVNRTFGVFNDTRFDDPISFTRTLRLDGKEVSRRTTEHRVPPGRDIKFDEELTLPEVAARTEGELVLTLSVAGKEVFRDSKPVSVLPPIAPPRGLKASDVLIFDPEGSTRRFFAGRKTPFTPVDSLDKLSPEARVLIVGKDAISAAEATSTRLAAYALSGHRVIVLEQKNPLRYQAVQPAEIETDANEGRTAFLEDASHPAVRGLKDRDFFTWNGDEIVYRDAYLKPRRGARSIIQCGELLKNSALVEIPIEDGLLILTGLPLGRSLGSNPVADTLFTNLVDHAVHYRREFRTVAVVADDNPQLVAAIAALGLKSTAMTDPVAAIHDPGVALVIASASPANLSKLAGDRKGLADFKARGGYLLLNGLTPEGLESFNTLVGVDHMIRPFRRERVLFPPVREPLSAGLSLSDVALFSSERIFPWQEGNFVASDIFSFVVDTDDVAPFARLFDRDPFRANMVNGFVSADAWKYIVNLPAPPEPPMDFVLDLPKPREIAEVEWIGNTFYYPVTEFHLIFDGSHVEKFPVKPNNDPQTFAIQPPHAGKDITLRLAAWDKPPGKGAVTGLDNIRLKPARSPEFSRKVRPMLNVGGLVHYPDGPGGIVLCNLLFKASEEVPANGEKKRAVLAAILRNLRAPFSSGRTIIAGSNLSYAPVDLSKQANAYRTERGLFGDPATSFKDLPTGRQTFASVPFEVFDFPTSPVPTIVMLRGQGVPLVTAEQVRGIPVGRKADALFFLQAARIDRRRNDQEIRDRKRSELARYIVHYRDGTTEAVPIDSEIDVDDYRQKTPSPLPGAQVGWTRPFPNSDLHAVAYVKQWTNPRPEIEIDSVDLVSSKDSPGVPALLAITAASVRP